MPLPADLTSTVAVPVWALVLVAALAALAVLDRLLVPSVRWALQRRANRAIEDLNAKLKLHIRPFKLTRRRVLIDSLLFDPGVLAAIDQASRDTGEPRDAAMERARRYAREIVPAFSTYAYFRVGTRLARRLSQALYRVRLGSLDDAALTGISPDAAVVFVINHRSNMDYVLVTYVTSSASALSYAVGEWAQIFPLRGLIRTMGAYFIRRNSSDPLYRKVLAAYVRTSTAAGVVQAVFPEGGLTRDGRMRAPKLGLISYMVQGFDARAERDIVFVPVGVNYDRVLEDRVMLAARGKDAQGTPSFRVSPFSLAGFLLNQLWLGLRGRWVRFGYAGVGFGQPVSLREWTARHGVDFRDLDGTGRNAALEALGAELMEAVGRVVPALPVSLVATVLLEADGAMLTPFELKGRVFELMSRLETAGARNLLAREERDSGIEAGVRMLVARHLAIDDRNGWRANPDERDVLRYYAGAIEHLLPPAHHSDARAATAERPAA